MSDLWLINGGLSIGSAPDSIANVLGGNSGGSFSTTSDTPPQPGIIGIESRMGASVSLEIPSRNSIGGTMFPGNAGRTFVSVYGEWTYTPHLSGSYNGKPGFALEVTAEMALCRIYCGTTLFRELVLLNTDNGSDLEAGTATAVTATTLTHVGAFTGNDYSDGTYFVVLGGREMQIISHTNDVLTGIEWFGGTPALGSGAYFVRRYQWQYRVKDNAGTTIGTSAKFNPTFSESQWDQMEFSWTPVSSTSQRVKLTKNGTAILTAGVAGDSEHAAVGTNGVITSAIKVYLMQTIGGKGSGSWVGDAYMRRWNTVLYDNLVGGRPDGDARWESTPQAYEATVANRPYVAYRIPLPGGTPTYGAWTKSSGTDAAALLDENPVDTTAADYIEETAANDLESWLMEAPPDMDKPIYDNTTTDPLKVFAVMTYGYGTAATGDLTCKHYYSGTLDAGRACEQFGTSLTGPCYCATFQPDATAWSYVALAGVESVAERTANAPRIHASRQLVLAIGGRQPNPRPRPLAILSQPSALVAAGSRI